jgi:hypothetical protein
VEMVNDVTCTLFPKVHVVVNICAICPTNPLHHDHQGNQQTHWKGTLCGQTARNSGLGGKHSIPCYPLFPL